jgi:hypothetical protein
MKHQEFVKGSISRFSGGVMTNRQKRRSEATEQRRKAKKARKAKGAR